MDKNLILYGLEQVHIAFHDGEGGFEEPEEITGAVSLATTPSSEQVIFHADNRRYFVRENNNGYNGTLEMALIPDDIKARMLGWEIDSNGMLVEKADGKPEHFALLGQVQGDSRNRRFVYYDVMAMRHGQDSATTGDTIDPNTQSLPVTITPFRHSGMNIVKGDIELSDANTGAYNGFFNAVLLPEGSAAGVNKTALNATIDLADTLVEGSYTVPTWAVLEAAVGVAEQVALEGTATQQAVNNANRDLKAAILALVAI